MRKKIGTSPLFKGKWLATLVVTVTGSIGSLPALAAEETETGTLSLLFENDLFYDTDRNYTNGVRASSKGSVPTATQGPVQVHG